MRWYLSNTYSIHQEMSSTPRKSSTPEKLLKPAKLLVPEKLMTPAKLVPPLSVKLLEAPISPLAELSALEDFPAVKTPTGSPLTPTPKAHELEPQGTVSAPALEKSGQPASSEESSEDSSDTSSDRDLLQIEPELHEQPLSPHVVQPEGESE